jgi:hypothetical protein
MFNQDAWHWPPSIILRANDQKSDLAALLFPAKVVIIAAIEG